MSDRLKEIAERAEKATPGPWFWDGGTVSKIEVDIAADPYADLPPDNSRTWEANGRFIAAAREDIPFLLAELQKRDKEHFDALVGAEGECLEETERLAGKLTEANKLLDQTIEVLEGLVKQTFPTNDYACPMCGGTWDYPVERHTFRCPYGKAKPLLDNLKALKKEADPNG